MNLARNIEEGTASIAVIQGGASNEKLEPVLSKYDSFIDILGQDHQLVLGVLETVPNKSTYCARTPIHQALLDRIVLQGSSLLRMVDRDMMAIATEHGNFEGNNLYSSLIKLRVALVKTISNYSKMVGAA